MSGTSDLRVFGILMTRNDGDILRANVLLHLAIGCERMIVVDNGSSDDTPKILKSLARKHPVDFTRDEGELRQPEIVTAMAQEARAKGAGWVVPLDTDEFWHPSRLLPEICADAERRGLGALEVSRIEFVQARDRIHASRLGPLRATRRVENVLLGNEAVEEFIAKKRSMFEIAPPSKLLMRTTADLSIARGAHTAEGLAGPIEVSADVAIFHLAMRSRDEAFSRVEHADRIDRVDSRPNVSVQNRYWQEMGAEGRLEEAWRAHSHSDGALEVAGRRVELVEDGRLAEILRPWLLGPLGRLRLRLVRKLARTP